MKITKYAHACFTVELEGRLLVVDPGGWTNDLGMPENVAAVVVTHEHADHFDLPALKALVTRNPQAKIIAHGNITRQLENSEKTLAHETVGAGDMVSIGPFHLEFFGGEHATIHPDLTPVANLGVMINEKLFYPGDSFVQPGKPVEILALPIAAPWLKVSETIDYLASIKPRLAFATHDAILSETGQALLDRLLLPFATKAGVTYQRINAEPVEI